MKLVICGHGRHGKDTLSEIIDPNYVSSSRVALDSIIWKQANHLMPYKTADECFEDRHNCREWWFKVIKSKTSGNPDFMFDEVYKVSSIYCGIRSIEEFRYGKAKGKFDLSIWVDASERVPPESQSSCTITKQDCDIIITNNSKKKHFIKKAQRLKQCLQLMRNDNIRNEITEWADSVFPNRTITNAIHKMVLEEIPEYLVNQKDPMELADIGILLYDIAHLAGVDLDEAIRGKLEINKKRSWTINKTTGIMKHDNHR